MNDLYIIIGGLRKRFVKVAERFTKDKNEIDNVVQELLLYFLQMNKETLQKIYDKDGEEGLVSYGAIAIRRSFKSPRSKYFYKYRKYYKSIDARSCNLTYEVNINNPKQYHNKYNVNYQIDKECDNVKKHQLLDDIDSELGKMYWYDREIFKLYYYKGHTLDSLAKKTKISRNSLFTTIDKVRKQLKNILDE
tara:strand:- start:7738 stop:8313 length:576 start_codon:yes stop_codon:yes gene_type:complete